MDPQGGDVQILGGIMQKFTVVNWKLNLINGVLEKVEFSIKKKLTHFDDRK